MKIKLFAPESYWSIPKEERDERYCGCGPGKIGDYFVPDTIWGLRITEACRIHDHQYEIGKTRADKTSADHSFLYNILRLIKAKTKWRWLKWLRRRRAWVYYKAVMRFGGPAYWKDKNKPEEMGDM